ncbi:MAG: hypothetical protein JWQ03_1227 [Variovorax sp.]|nr:hypothetical protein [Variovorax sp.]
MARVQGAEQRDELGRRRSLGERAQQGIELPRISLQGAWVQEGTT